MRLVVLLMGLISFTLSAQSQAILDQTAYQFWIIAPTKGH